MPNPLLIGGLLVGGTLAAWRLARRHQRRLRTIVERITLPKEDGHDRPVPLEQDPATGIYRPASSRQPEET